MQGELCLIFAELTNPAKQKVKIMSFRLGRAMDKGRGTTWQCQNIYALRQEMALNSPHSRVKEDNFRCQLSFEPIG